MGVPLAETVTDSAGVPSSGQFRPGVVQSSLFLESLKKNVFPQRPNAVIC